MGQAAPEPRRIARAGMRPLPLATAFFLLAGVLAAKETETAQPFLPGHVSTAATEVRLAISPDGKRMLWGAIGWTGGAGGWDIYESTKTAKGWSKPVSATFNSAQNDFDPFFAPDGSGVYFFSNRDGGL